MFLFFIRLASSLSISPFYVCSLVRALCYARMHWYDGRKFFVAIIKLVKVMNKLEKLMLHRRKVRNCTHVNVSCCRRNESWFAIRNAHKLNNANQSLTLTRKWQMANGKRQKTTYPNETEMQMSVHTPSWSMRTRFSKVVNCTFMAIEW